MVDDSSHQLKVMGFHFELFFLSSFVDFIVDRTVRENNIRLSEYDEIDE